MKIYLVRHGETASNKDHRIMGQRIDEPLNDEGRSQAKEVAQKLKNQSFDMIFSSPLKRALGTAEAIVQELQLPLIIRDEIKERDFGSLSGKNWKEIGAIMNISDMIARQQDFDQEYDYAPCGGESAENVHERLLSFIEELKEKYRDKKVLVIAHGGILRAAEFLFNKRKTGHIENVAVMEFEVG